MGFGAVAAFCSLAAVGGLLVKNKAKPAPSNQANPEFTPIGPAGSVIHPHGDPSEPRHPGAAKRGVQKAAAKAAASPSPERPSISSVGTPESLPEPAGNVSAAA